MYLSDDLFPLSVAARSSPLSQAQVEELLVLLRRSYPDALFEPHFLLSHGDRDKAVSLRSFDKSDFFTREIDELVLNGRCRIAVHSAKDLPDEPPPGLQIVALTEGVDNRDALVMRDEETIEGLPPGAVVATSSLRREEAVRAMREDFVFTDIRGNIGERLAFLDSNQIDAVVVAEAALLRLNLGSRNRVYIPGETALHQGRLAVVARVGDFEVEQLFAAIDSGERV